MADPTWKTQPVGCGGLITGFDIAPDGTAVGRSDVGGLYGFTGKLPADMTDPTKKWVQLMNNASLKDSAGTGTFLPPGGATTWFGALDVKIAPTLTTRLYAWMPRNKATTGYDYQWALYYSTDFGAHWLQTALLNYGIDGGSNGTWRRSQGLIAVDPNNALVVYTGMRTNSANGSGASAGCFFAIDGQTFNPVTSDGSTNLPAVTSAPGCTALAFDNNYTGGTTNTTTAHGVTCTKRLLIPIGGTDVYETLDGGATFSATGFATAAGRADFGIMQGKMDYDGVYYCLVTYAGANGFGSYAHVWRYAGAAARGPAANTGWVELSAASGFPDFGPSSAYHSGLYAANSAVIVVDPRNGHQGFVSVFGPNGIGQGYTASPGTSGANAASASSVVWNGGTGGETPILHAPTYDVGYLSTINSNGLNSFADSPDCQIDLSGNCRWCGNQGLIWLFTQSDFSTPTIPSYPATITYSVSLSRGAEATVAQEVIRPPGQKYPVLAAQDVGIHVSGFVQGQYPTDWYPGLGNRSDGTSLCWAPNNPAFIAACLSREGNTPLTCDLSGYASNSDDITTWKQYVNSAIPNCAGAFTGSIDNFGVMTISAMISGNFFPGASTFLATFNSCTGFIDDGLGGGSYDGAPGKVLTVTASTPGVLGQNQGVAVGGVLKGVIKSQLTGTSGGIGTYQLDTASATPSSSMTCFSFGGDTGTNPTSQLTNTNGSSTPFKEGTYQMATCIFTAYFDDGLGGGSYDSVSGTSMTVTASSGLGINAGRVISIGGVVKGTVVSQTSSAESGARLGGKGVYVLNTSNAIASSSCIGATPYTSQPFSCFTYSVGGQIIVLDEDHHLMVPFASGATQVPGNSQQQPVFRTSAARDPSNCNWQICYDLSVWDWCRRGYSSGTAAKPLAADQVTAGVAYAAKCDATTNTVYIYKTTNYGTNWTQVGSFSFGSGGNYAEPLLLPVRGHAGHLFFTSSFTSGTANYLKFSDDAGATWASVNLPATYNLPQKFAVGAIYAGYPKLYFMGSDGTNTKLFSTIFDPTVKTANWQTVGATGLMADHAPSCQLTGLTTLNADPVVPDLLYGSSGTAGFEYFGDTQVAVHLHW